MPARSPALKGAQPAPAEGLTLSGSAPDMSGYDRSLRAQRDSGDFDLSSRQFARVLLGFVATIVVIAIAVAWAVSA